MLQLRLGRKPTLYTYSAFNEQFKCGTIFGNDYNLHIEDYRERPSTVSVGWKGYSFHQYAGNDERQVGVADHVTLIRFEDL
jgi:hypothetical protein